MSAPAPYTAVLTLNVVRDTVAALVNPDRGTIAAALPGHTPNALASSLADAVKRGLVEKLHAGRPCRVTYRVPTLAPNGLPL